MKILIPLPIQKKLIPALQKANDREIGGILMGEHIGVDEFNVTDLTIQTGNGTLVSFVRLVSNAVTALTKFFEKTNKNYTRFNYLGEWHSHPSFMTTPSQKDINSMIEIIQDKEVNANFAVLVIVKLNDHTSLEGSATVFYKDMHISQCNLVFFK